MPCLIWIQTVRQCDSILKDFFKVTLEKNQQIKKNMHQTNIMKK